MKFNRSVYVAVASAAVALTSMVAAGSAQARDVSWSVGVGVPGVVVGAANNYYSPAPVYVQPAPVYYAPPPPVYYAPRPVYYAPPRPAYYAPPPAYYAPPRYQGYYDGGYGRHYHGGYR